ncbi:N-acetylglucosamine-6-phosphate deacetylase [Paenibacillus psychroresistens]|uniref:N-acetylglucosamine-6-phosphate deacetylase n=1 Tax=Paenibacillus psychroresistens TaxID=1778678 RepID=A0A6B8RSM8_9BACL|nr:N-acetylglucosamine-6-phosphate deacetylase [Paenibacillus psychroresistens]QGQ98565.1 N-acetylglucosamine-6-phosphate deacetylase [Paenibacillus psychroresistens]
MKSPEAWIIKNGRIVVQDGSIIENGALLVNDGKMAWVGTEAELKQFTDVDKIIDAQGSWVLPGFIDVHVHGGFGADFMDATRESLETITGFHSKNGTTAMLATTMTAPHEGISAVLSVVDDYMQGNMPYAQLLGVHLEGPFISPKFPGAQNPAFIVLPQIKWLEDWIEQHPDVIRLLTLAPEREGALPLISWLKSQGITVACGHTDASYDQIEAAVEHGLQHAVHTFNAMRVLHHREPGTVGAVLSDDRIYAEVIADGHHVHPACIQLLSKAKPQDRLLLVTDAMSATGLAEGLFELGGLKVVVKGGVARLLEGDSLAGSTLTMIDAFRFCVEKVGLSIPQVSQMASGNPAATLGFSDQMGSIAVGKQADLLLVSADLQLQNVWIKGRAL